MWRHTSSPAYISRPMANIARDAVVAAQHQFRPKKEGTRAGTRASLPADLAALVLFLQPAHQRLEVVHHRASGDVFAGRFFQYFSPVFGAAFFQNVVQPRADFLVIGVITRLRRLM